MGIFTFPGTNYHDLNLDWLLTQMKNCLTNWETVKDDWESLEAYVTDYFHNLDVSEEINNIIAGMVSSGALLELMNAPIEQAVSEWLFAHYEAGTLAIDKTLSIEAAAAPATAAGAMVATRIPPVTPVYAAGNLFKGNYLFNMGFVGTQQAPTMNRNAGRITAVIDCLAEGIPYGENAEPISVSLGTVAEGSRRLRVYCADTLDPATANVTAALLRNGAQQAFDDSVSILQNVMPAKRFLLIYCNLANATPVTPAMIPSYLRVFYSRNNSLATIAYTGGTLPKGSITHGVVYCADTFIRFVASGYTRLAIKTSGQGIYSLPAGETITTYETLAATTYDRFLIVGYPRAVETAYSETSNASTYTQTVEILYLNVAAALDAIADGACYLGYVAIDRNQGVISDFHMETECHFIRDDARHGMVNVRAYLRDPNGTNVSNDLQAAIETATMFGAVAYLRANVYNIQKTLYLPPKTHLQCEPGAVIHLYDITEDYEVNRFTGALPTETTPADAKVTAQRRVAYQAGANPLASAQRTDPNIRTYIHALAAGRLFPSLWRQGAYQGREYHYPIVMAGVPNDESNIVIENLTVTGRTYGANFGPMPTFSTQNQVTEATIFRSGSDWTDKLEMDGILLQGDRIRATNLRTMSINFEPWLFNQNVESWATPAGGSGTNHAPAWAVAVREGAHVLVDGLTAIDSGYEGLGFDECDDVTARKIFSVSASRCAIQVHANCTDIHIDDFYAIAAASMPETRDGYAYNANSLPPDQTTGGITHHCNQGYHNENLYISNGTTKTIQEVTGYSGGAMVSNVTFTSSYIAIQAEHNTTPTAVYIFTGCKTEGSAYELIGEAGYIKALAFNGCVQYGDGATEATYQAAMARTTNGSGVIQVTYINA